MKSLIRSFQSLAPIFKPPFPGLWLVVLLYYVWCFIVYPHSQAMRGNFPDPDDYMYLVQVMDWVKGAAGWYDNIQHRLNPPYGVMIQFSRLAMVPMAWLVVLFEKLFGLGPRGSSILMAEIYPIILLGGFLVTMRKFAESFLPKDWAGVTAYIALFSTALMYMFEPGHVDHHGLMILVIAGVLCCAMRMMEQPDQIRWGLAAGVILALGLTLALEILPWILIICGWLGLWAVVKGPKAAYQGLAFALSLHLASIVFLLLTRPPADFFTFDVLTYSAVYVFLTGGIAVCFAGSAATASAPLPVRIGVGVVLAALSGFLFLHQFPDLVNGPYGAMDPELQELVLGVVNEAEPMTERMPGFFMLAVYSSASILAICAGIYFGWKDARPRRWLWGLLLSMLIGAFLLTTFYQCRYAGTEGMLTIIPLAVLLQRGWIWAQYHLQGRRKVFAEIGLLILVGPLLSVFLPALADGRSFNKGILLFPVVATNEPCDTFVLEQVLRDSIHLGDRPRLILADMGLGPELLFRTSHSALAAPFFDTEGNMDSYRFFSTLYPEEAKAIALRRHVDLVISCKLIGASYLRTTIAQPDNVTVKKDIAPHFIERLVVGRAPDWLQQVKIPALNNYVIYQVVPPEGEAGKPVSQSLAPSP